MVRHKQQPADNMRIPPMLSHQPWLLLPTTLLPSLIALRNFRWSSNHNHATMAVCQNDDICNHYQFSKRIQGKTDNSCSRKTGARGSKNDPTNSCQTYIWTVSLFIITGICYYHCPYILHCIIATDSDRFETYTYTLCAHRKIKKESERCWKIRKKRRGKCCVCKNT